VCQASLTPQQIIQRLEAMNIRFTELEKQHQEGLRDDRTPPSQDMDAELIDELLFSQLPNLGFPQGGLPGFPGFDFAALGFPGLIQPSQARLSEVEATPKGGAYLRTLSPSERPARAETSGDVMSWGSEVEMPPPGESITPPRPPPTIHVQPPTDSNVGKSQRAVTPSAPSHTAQRTPRQYDADLAEANVNASTALPDPRERDLPLPPSESARSQAPSRIAKTTSRKSRVAEPLPRPDTSQQDDRQSQTAYQIAVQEPLRRPLSAHRDKLHIFDPISPRLEDPTPWDLVTQRLYSWALVWEEETFLRALENISLGHQVSTSDLRSREIR